MSRRDCDVLIVGAGLAGAATAYHLGRSGGGRVWIVEQEDLPGTHSSGRNAAMVRARIEGPFIAELARTGATFLRRGTLAEFRPTGSILLGLGDEDVSRRVAPAVGCGLWCPEDGVVDVHGLLLAYLRGQDVRYQTRVLSWKTHDSHVEVETNRGTIRCGLLVNAAGPWAGELGRLPLTPLGRHLFVTPPMEGVRRNWPFVWDLDGGFYFRPESGGLLLCVCDEVTAPPGHYDTRHAPLERLAQLSRAYLPGLGEMAVKRMWVGQRTFAPDRRFVIGHDPRHPRLFHMAALGGHGVTASWAVGRLAAERILAGGTLAEEAFAPARLFEDACPAAGTPPHSSS